MTVKDAQQFVKYIRKENYRPNPIQEKFLTDIESGIKFKSGHLTDKQVEWLKSIYGKATA